MRRGKQLFVLLLALLALEDDLELGVGAEGLDAEEEGGALLGLEDLGLVYHDMEERVVADRGVHKGEVDCGWEAGVDGG